MELCSPCQALRHGSVWSKGNSRSALPGLAGATRKSAHVLSLINHVFDAKASDGAVGVTALLNKGRIVLIADTLVHEWPDETDLANIAVRAAGVALEG